MQVGAPDIGTFLELTPVAVTAKVSEITTLELKEGGITATAGLNTLKITPAKIEATVGTSTITLNEAGVSINGTTISLNALAQMKVQVGTRWVSVTAENQFDAPMNMIES